MSVDKFGRFIDVAAGAAMRGPPGEGFQLTDSGDYDMLKKRLCNVSDPLDSSDAINVSYMTTQFEKQRNQILQKTPKKAQSSDGWLFEKLRIMDVGYPEDENDAATRKYVKDTTPEMKADKWIMKRKRISEVDDPIEVLDAVNYRTLIVALRNIYFMLKGLEMPFYEWLDNIIPSPEDLAEEIPNNIHEIIKEIHELRRLSRVDNQKRKKKRVDTDDYSLLKIPLRTDVVERKKDYLTITLKPNVTTPLSKQEQPSLS